MKTRLFTLALVGVVSFLGGTLIPSARTEPQAQAQVQPPKYYLVDCMKVNPGKFDLYFRVEREWKLIHQDYVKRGKKRSWGLYGVQYPAGTDERCDYVTVNAFDKYADTEDPYADFQEVFKRLYPNMKLEELAQRTDDSRRLTHEELLVLVDHTD